MTEKTMKGLIAAPFTPMDKNGEISLDGIGRYADHLYSSGVSGVFICGTTGEGLSMTAGERKRVLEEWIRSSPPDLKIISHVGGNCLSECKELAAHASKTGAFAIGAFAPSFYRPGNAAELVDFLVPVASSAPDLPFFYYNIPSFTGVNVPVSEVMAAADGVIPNFAGAKFSHSDLFDMQRCLAFKDGKYEVLHGYDETLLCGLSLGVKAAIGSTYNYIPGLYLEIWKSFGRSDMETARKLQQESVRIIQILFKYGGGVRAGKAIMGFLGIDCGPCRLPVPGFSSPELLSFRKDLTAAGFFEFAGMKD